MAGESTCCECPSHEKYTHSLREHAVAEAWIPAFLDYIKVDAFDSLDRALPCRDAVANFSLDTTVRRAGPALDAVAWILKPRGWSIEACAGVAA